MKSLLEVASGEWYTRNLEILKKPFEQILNGVNQHFQKYLNSKRLTLRGWGTKLFFHLIFLFIRPLRQDACSAYA